MGSPPSLYPDPVGTEPISSHEAPASWVPRQPRPARVWRHVVLFVLTAVTTTIAGGNLYAGFLSDFGNTTLPESVPALLTGGLWYSVSVLAILGAHELGHYFACRYYGVDASLPYFIPLPVLLPISTGTLGAVIRIRQPFPGKRELFDIGIAGPIAGFLVAVPVLFLGLTLSRAVQLPADTDNVIQMGEPLLFKGMEWLVFGSLPDGYDINMHPMGFAAWFGMLATALNLFPIAQLDGGHISYAVLGRGSTKVTIATMLTLCALTLVYRFWILWTALLIVVLFVAGPHHPRTPDEDVPLDPTRRWLAVFAAAMFILCFTPSPIGPFVE